MRQRTDQTQLEAWVKLEDEKPAYSKSSIALRFTLALSVYAFQGIGNLVYQHSKHIAYHATGTKHIKIDDDPDRSFFYYART